MTYKNTFVKQLASAFEYLEQIKNNPGSVSAKI